MQEQDRPLEIAAAWEGLHKQRWQDQNASHPDKLERQSEKLNLAWTSRNDYVERNGASTIKERRGVQLIYWKGAGAHHASQAAHEWVASCYVVFVRFVTLLCYLTLP